MKSVLFFLATAFAIGVSVPVNKTDDDEFIFTNETQLEPVTNETIASGDFLTDNFSTTEEPQHEGSAEKADTEEKKPSVRSLEGEDTKEYKHEHEYESGSGLLDTGSAEIVTGSGIQEIPDEGGKRGEEEPESGEEEPEGDEDEEEEEEGATGDTK